MTWWEALLLGLVEGLTEYLPVSSTGHLILTGWLLGFADDPERWAASFTFNIVIQAGAIAAVLLIYRERVFSMVRGVLGKDPDGRRLAGLLVLAFLPAAVLGVLFDDMIESCLNGPWPVVVALFAGGVLMLVVSRSHAAHRAEEGVPAEGLDLDALTARTAFLIGLAQCVAMWPGTSRSMMTIVAALLLGLSAPAAAEFSFLLGLITLSAATGYKLVLGGDEMFAHFGVGPFAVGLIAATISAAIAVRWFVGFLNRRGLAPFGWYRLVLASLLALGLWTGWFSAPPG